MSWKSAMREAGYDPGIVRDASAPLVLGNIEKVDLKGAVIGDPLCCCGANHIRREIGAELAWVGAQNAVIVFNKKKALRFRHNGGIPSMQDKGFFPIGYPVRMVPISPSQRLEKMRSNGHVKTTHTKKSRGSTIAGEFRR